MPLWTSVWQTALNRGPACASATRGVGFMQLYAGARSHDNEISGPGRTQTRTGRRLPDADPPRTHPGCRAPDANPSTLAQSRYPTRRRSPMRRFPELREAENEKVPPTPSGAGSRRRFARRLHDRKCYSVNAQGPRTRRSRPDRSNTETAVATLQAESLLHLLARAGVHRENAAMNSDAIRKQRPGQ